jgi:hypothetical protein
MPDVNDWNGVNDERIAALRDSIQRAFPVVAYTGQITRCDGAWLPELTEENAIHDDDMFVYEALKDQKWTDVPKALLHTQPDGFVLLTDEALVAYLAAWLMCSLDDIEGENEVREFVVYSFSPADLTPNDEFKANRIRALNPEQRLVLRSALAEFARSEPSEFIRQNAVNAVEFIDGVLGRVAQ